MGASYSDTKNKYGFVIKHDVIGTSLGWSFKVFETSGIKYLSHIRAGFTNRCSFLSWIQFPAYLRRLLKTENINTLSLFSFHVDPGYGPWDFRKVTFWFCTMILPPDNSTLYTLPRSWKAWWNLCWYHLDLSQRVPKAYMSLSFRSRVFTRAYVLKALSPECVSTRWWSHYVMGPPGKSSSHCSVASKGIWGLPHCPLFSFNFLATREEVLLCSVLPLWYANWPPEVWKQCDQGQTSKITNPNKPLLIPDWSSQVSVMVVESCLAQMWKAW